MIQTERCEVTLLSLINGTLIAKLDAEIVAVETESADKPLVLAQGVVHAEPDFVLVRTDDELWVRRLNDRTLEPVGPLPAAPGMRPVGFTGAGDLLLVHETRMSSELFIAPVGGETIHQLFGGDAVVRREVATSGAMVFFVVTTATRPEELWLYRPENRRALRLAALSARSPVDVRVERITWQSSDGTDLEGLLVLPSATVTPLPTLLFIHGGPEDRVRFDFHYLASLHQGGAALAFASRGWAVFLPNFRGSIGYGDDFRRALQNGRYLSVPADDALSGVQALVNRGIADSERTAIAGFSYGGTLTAWIIGREHHFRAACAMAGDLDLLQNDRSRLRGNRALHALGGLRSGPDDGLRDAWLAADKYRELSPVETAVKIRTPVLILSTAMEHLSGTGEAAFFNGASLLGTPVRWIHYPTVWHGGSWSPDDRVDATQRVMEWLEEWTLEASKDTTSPDAGAVVPNDER